MRNPSDIHRAVTMQEHSYRLLKWMAKAVEEGFIRFETAHSYTTLPEAAQAWILRHYLNIPPDARVAHDDLPDFCMFFSTYLENSFDLVMNPGKRLYSPDAHCFCPMCSWLVNAPHLQTKKVTADDKRRARKMKIAAVRDMAAEHAVTATDEEVDAIVDDRRLNEAVSLVTYGRDLLRRMRGIAAGPAVLVLWRGFAWTDSGSPKKKYRLKADAILDSERQLADVLLTHARNHNPKPT